MNIIVSIVVVISALVIASRASAAPTPTALAAGLPAIGAAQASGK